MINVLFLCTGNTARSILSEAILRQLGAGRFTAYSAGSQPKGTINPLALKVLQERGFAVEELSSKSWDVFAAEGAPRMRIIITVCGNAAGEVCPVWPGNPATAHWGVADPHSKAEFAQAFETLHARIKALAPLNLEGVEPQELRMLLAAIAELG